MAHRPEFAPIALFAYMRPDHLRLTVQSLQANAEAAFSDLHVFCDAPKRSRAAVVVAEGKKAGARKAAIAKVAQKDVPDAKAKAKNR